MKNKYSHTYITPIYNSMGCSNQMAGAVIQISVDLHANQRKRELHTQTIVLNNA
jgi:hypothetical protein